MRLFIAGIIAGILTLLTPSPANADEGCVLTVAGVKVCGTLLGQPLPAEVTVTVKPDPIRIPGPTVTLPPLPGPTVTVPGEPGATVTIPGPTETVTATPNNAGPTTGPSALPSPTGQPTTPSATVSPTPENGEPTDETRTKTETIVRTVIIGTLALLLLAAAACLALWAGYVLGYKGAERNETRSLRNLVDSITAKRND